MSDKTETRLPIPIVVSVSSSMPEDIIALIEETPIEFECKELGNGKALVTVTQQTRMKAFVKILDDDNER